MIDIDFGGGFAILYASDDEMTMSPLGQKIRNGLEGFDKWYARFSLRKLKYIHSRIREEGFAIFLLYSVSLLALILGKSTTDHYYSFHFLAFLAFLALKNSFAAPKNVQCSVDPSKSSTMFVQMEILGVYLLFGYDFLGDLLQGCPSIRPWCLSGGHDSEVLLEIQKRAWE